jgi:hypothetical protein
MCCHTSLYYPVVYDANDNPTSQVHLPVGITDYRELRNIKSVAFSGIMSVTKFHPNPTRSSRIESYRWTDMISTICIHFIHIMERMHNN